MKLIITDSNWADEISLWGFEVVSDVYFDFAQEVFKYFFEKNPKEDLTVYVGTNEDVQFYANDYMSHFSVKEITPQDEAKLILLFGSSDKGHTLFDSLVEVALDSLYDDPMYKVFNDRLSQLVKEGYY